VAFQYLKGAYKQEGECLFTRVDGDWTRGIGFILRQGRFRLDIRKKFFTQRVVMHWNRLPKEAVDAPSLEAFKARLAVALGSLVCWLATLHVAGGLKLNDHEPRPFCDSTIQWFYFLWGKKKRGNIQHASVHFIFQCVVLNFLMSDHRSVWPDDMQPFHSNWNSQTQALPKRTRETSSFYHSRAGFKSRPPWNIGSVWWRTVNLQTNSALSIAPGKAAIQPEFMCKVSVEINKVRYF